MPNNLLPRVIQDSCQIFRSLKPFYLALNKLLFYSGVFCRGKNFNFLKLFFQSVYLVGFKKYFAGGALVYEFRYFFLK
jgi:hypothetical protein